MKYRELGKSGISVSEIGFGSWGIGGLSKGEATSYGATDDEESKRALNFAFENGVNLYDTSNIYGDGHSEKLIGDVFQGKRDKIVIATKVGFTHHNSLQDFSSINLRNSLEGSLKRLRTDYVDLYQLHSPYIPYVLKNLEEILGTLLDLRKEGKIRHWGISARSPEDGVKIVSLGDLSSIQINFNMIDQRALDCNLFSLVNANRCGIILRTPLAFGFLTGKIIKSKFDKEDHRSRWSSRQIEMWIKASDLFLPIAESRNCTLSQLAFLFCLYEKSASSVIPGMLTVNQVRENIASSDLEPLTEKEIKLIREIYCKNTFFEE